MLALRIEKIMGISSKLLLALDSNYKLNLAKADIDDQRKESPLFLRKYDWVNKNTSKLSFN